MALARHTSWRSTHNLPEAEAVADRVAIMARGRVRREGTASALRGAPDGMQSFALTLAGPPGEHIALLRRLDGVQSAEVAAVTDQEHTIMYRTATPHVTNASVVAQLVERRAAIVSLEPRPRSLAEVYLETIEEAERWT